MDAALILAAAGMGLAGSPHCAAMCAAPCAAATASCGRGLTGPAAFQAGRLLSYMVGGAVAASSVASIAALSQAAPMLRPVWTLLHVAALVIGAWMLVTGAMPRWLGHMGRPWRRRVAAAGGVDGWRPVQGPLRPAAAGLAWIAWPCGLLQSALLVAALASSPFGGAAAMGAFAVTSSIGLLAGPALWARFARGGGAARADINAWAARLAGAGLVLASSWALGHGLWQKALAWCLGG